MKVRLKKALSLLLALVMAMSCMSMGAFATGAGTEEDPYLVTTADEFKTAAAAGGYIKLSNDITISETITFAEDTILDLNGCTLTNDVYNVRYAFKAQKNLTIKDSSPNKSGKICACYIFGACILVGTSNAGATATLESGTIESSNFTFDTYSNSNIVITGGNILVLDRYGASQPNGIVNEVMAGTTVSISGGKFLTNILMSQDPSFDPIKGRTGSISETGSVAITGGTFVGKQVQKYIPGYESTQDFSENALTVTIGDYTVTRSTETFTAATPNYDQYLYTVESAKNYVAQVNDGAKYETLAEAVAAANDGDTVKMLANAENTGAITVGKNFTLDLNGQTITSSSVLFNCYSNYNFTIKDSGENGAIDVSADKIVYVTSGKLTLEGGALSVHSSSSHTYGIQVGSSGSFEMTGGSITIPSSSTSTYNYCVGNSGGTVTISGGSMTAEASGGNYTVSSSSGTVEISGGSFEGRYSTAGMGYSPYVLYITGGSATVTGGYFRAVGNKDAVLPGHLVDESKHANLVIITGGCFGGTYYYNAWGSNGTGGSVATDYRVFANPDMTTKTTYPYMVAESVILWYQGNGGSTDSSKTSTGYYKAKGFATTTAAADLFTREGYVFTGWNTEADGSGTPYAAEDSITMNETVNLYAQWETDTTNVAQIGETKYESLSDAIKYAKAGDKIELIANVPDTDLTHVHGKYDDQDHFAPNVTVEGKAGITCVGIYFNSNDDDGGISGLPSGWTFKDINFVGKGLRTNHHAVTNLTVTGCTFTDGAVLHVTDKNATNIVVSNCTFTGVNATGSGGDSAIYIPKANGLTVQNCTIQDGSYNAIQAFPVAGNGDVTITGNTFSGINSRIINMANVGDKVDGNYDNTTYTGTITISGNTFNLPTTPKDDCNFIRVGKEIIIGENTYATVNPDKDLIDDYGYYFSSAPAVTYAASITRNDNVTEYASAQAALDAAIDGDTITLYAGDHGDLFLRCTDANSVSVDLSTWAGNGDVERFRTLKNVTIQAAENETVTVSKLTFETGQQPANQNSQNKNVLGYMDVENLTIKGITFTPTGAVMTIGNGSDHLDIDGLTFDRCTVIDDSESANGSKLLYTLLTHGTKYQYSNGNVSMDITDGLDNLVIKDCTFKNLHQVAEIRETNGFTFTGNSISGTRNQTLLLTINTNGEYSVSGTVNITNNISTGSTERFLRVSAASAQMTITGNTVTGYNGKDPDIVKIVDSGIDATYTLNNNSWMYQNDTTAQDDMTAYGAGRINIDKWPAKVAEVNGVQYATLAAAIAAANESGNCTITLLKDYDMEANEPGYGYTTSFRAQGETTARNNMLEFSGSNITFDLGGHRLSNLFNNTFSVTGSNVTIQNGEMRVGELYYSSLDGKTVYTSVNDKTCSYIVYVTGAQNFVVNNLTTYGGINVIGAGTTGSATATINNLHFSGTKFYAVCSQEGASVTLNGGTYDKSMAGSGKNLFYVGSDDPNMGDSYLYITGGYYKQGAQAGFSVIGEDAHIVISGGTFDKQPTQSYLATGYTTEQISGGTYNEWYTVVADSNAFVSVTVTSDTPEESSTTVAQVTKESGGPTSGTTTTQTFAFATAGATSDDVSYAIKIDTQVKNSSTNEDVEDASNGTTYQPVQTAVTNAGKVSNSLSVTEDTSLSDNSVSNETISAAKTTVQNAVTTESSTTITAKKGDSDISILGTQAAGNAFAKAAKEVDDASQIKKAEVELRSTYTASTLKYKNDAVTATSVTVDVKPYAVLKGASGNTLGEELMDNTDLTAENISITFKQAVPFETGALVNVYHNNVLAGSNLVVDENHEVEITTNGFSSFEIKLISEETVANASDVNYVAGYTLTLQGQIGVNFYLHLKNDVVSDPNSKVVFTFRNRSDKTRTIAVAGSADVIGGKTYYKFPFLVAPAECDENITLTLYTGDNVIPVYVTSGESYVTSDNGAFVKTLNQITRLAIANGTKVGATTEDEKLLPLAQKLLSYCVYSKQYFAKSNTVEEANSDAVLTSDQISEAKADLGLINRSAGTAPDGTNYVGTSLVLNSETAIKMYFTGNQNSFSYRKQGSEGILGTLNPVQDGSRYYIKIPNIVAAHLDDMYEVLCGDTVVNTYSALAWAKSVCNSGTAYKENLAAAMYYYNDAANTYFGAGA